MDETQLLRVACRSPGGTTLKSRPSSVTRGAAGGKWRRSAMRQPAAGVASSPEASAFIPGSISDGRSGLGSPD